MIWFINFPAIITMLFGGKRIAEPRDLDLSQDAYPRPGADYNRNLTTIEREVLL